MLTVLLAALCVAQFGCDDEGIACTAKSVESVSGTVTDSAGNPLLVYAVEAQVGRRTFRGCYGRLGSFSCRDLPAGDVKVTAQLMDQAEVIGRVQLGWAAGEEGCHTQRAELNLVRSDAGCSALASSSERSAVRGTVRDARGEPVSLQSMQITPSREYEWLPPEPFAGEPCTVEADRFDCPAVTPYTAMYELSANAQGSSFTREVFVPASACEIELQELEIAVDEACAQPRAPALEVVISRADGGSAQTLSTAEVVARWEDMPSYSCTFSARSEQEELYRCKGRGLHGAGHYSVEVSTYQGGLFAREIDVGADECGPETARVEIVVP